MRYFAMIVNGKLTSPWSLSDVEDDSQILTDGVIEISEDIFKSLVNLPADFTTDEEGKVISVTCPPLETVIQPPSADERLSALEDAMLTLMGGGM